MVSLEKQNQGNIYRSVIDDSLSSTICDTNRKIIADACAQNDSVLDYKNLVTAVGDDANPITAKIFSYADRETRKIINFAGNADTSAEDRANALHHLGLLLRPMLDFYFRSNYIELKLEEGDPLRRPAPYDIEPLKLAQVGHDAQSISRHGFEYGDIDKTQPTSTQGKKLYEKATYHSIVKELGVKETQRRWNTIEQLIKVKFPQKSAQIIAALKQSKCSNATKFEDY
ncbi:MAG: hypothetical protein P4L53_10740 [Candidatus Obscuribacterales bacterium]|nr:hypothetical protein [Candidatus Obscuribacterales bacterium]